VTVDDAHIKTINTLAARLERQNSDELATVKKRRQQLNERYILLYFNWDPCSIKKIHLSSCYILHVVCFDFLVAFPIDGVISMATWAATRGR